MRNAVKITLVLVVALALLVAARALGVTNALRGLLGWISSLGAIGPLVFILAYIAACVLFIPGSIMTIGAGVLFGVFRGSVYVSIGATIGATLAFLIGCYFARARVAAKLAGNATFNEIDAAVGREGWKIVGLTRLSPVFPFNLLNYAYGLTRVSLRDYVIASWIGMLPGIVMYCYIGSLIGDLTRLGNTSGSRAPARLLGTFNVSRLLPRPSGSRFVRRRGSRAARSLRKGSRTPEMDAPPSLLPLAPLDDHNRRLVQNVHPAGWRNPTPQARYNLVVIGAGTAGLVIAAGAAGLGAKVALVERDLMGGDCLNFGCVPSKAIIRASRAAAEIRDADRFGIHVPDGVRVDFGAVMERMRRLRADLSVNDSAARFAGLGVDVFIGDAHFSGRDTVVVGDATLRFRRAAIATGARAADLADPRRLPGCRLSHQRNNLLADRTARAHRSNRWRSDRLRTGAGAVKPARC